MKKSHLLSVLSLVFFTGCASDQALIKASGTSVRNDIFQELPDRAAVPTGFADLRVVSILKTHNAGVYAVTDNHGTPDFRLLINIDGQALQLNGVLRKENTEPERALDPEAGNGTRYRFSTLLRLKPGAHRLVVALPDDGIAIKKELNLKEEELHSLELKPVYDKKRGTTRPWYNNARSFTEGLRSFRVILNGREI